MATQGPAYYSPYPVATYEGLITSPEGKSIVLDEMVDPEEGMRAAVKAMLTKDNPTIFPGPKVLYGWDDEHKKQATLIKELADVLGAKMIPMYDYRPKYPKIDPEVEINPNHPNLTIWHNDIKAAIFVGVHCHYANVALKIVRSETDCYTIALCGMQGHEDAMVSLRDMHAPQLERLIEIAKEVKAELGK